MGWATLQGLLDAAAADAAAGDPLTAPPDGCTPVRCPVCFTLLAHFDGRADCPLGHYRWP